MKKTGTCTECGRTHFSLTKYGRVWSHVRSDGSRCKGSGQYPAENQRSTPQAKSETRIDFWTRRAEDAEHSANSQRALVNSSQSRTGRKYRDDISECYEELAQFCRTELAKEQAK